MMRILFIPVSSEKGIGEYMRSRAIADHLSSTSDNVEIKFVLNQNVNYLNECPYPTYLCPDSPTKHNRLVKEYLKEFTPHVVIFDAAGRVAQLKYAKKMGATTLFLCQHNKKLQKGLGVRRLKYTDEILIVQPKFAIAPLTAWQKEKLRLYPTKLRSVGPIIPIQTDQEQNDILCKYGLRSRDYILVNSGSGGHIKDGISCAEVFSKAADKLASSCNYKVINVYGSNYQGIVGSDVENLRNYKSIQQKDFIALLANAAISVTGGGSGLYQAIHYGTPTVSCVVSSDQPERIQNCVKQKLTVQAQLECNDIEQKVHDLLIDSNRINFTGMDNGITETVRIIGSYG